MDFLLDAADRAMGALRKRHPRVMFAVALVLWLPVLVFLVLLTWASGVWPLVVLVSLPTIALTVTVALRGLRRTWTPVWALGAGAIVFLSGPAPQWWNPSDELHGLAISVGAFIYAQIYFGFLGVLDHFWTARHSRTESIEDARFRLRRMLQVRLAMATLVVVFAATSDKADAYPPVMPLGALFGLAAIPIMIAVWTRVRTFAWAAAVALAVLSLGNLLLLFDAGARERALTEFAWAQVVAIYLWMKAARVWYWPLSRPQPPPGYPFPWPPPAAAVPTRPGEWPGQSGARPGQPGAWPGRAGPPGSWPGS
ncbi:hypothetical protein AB0M20_31025 [Actinoplanes sp. NPDC051633]|uniref:hypothetical protein n=1 Tax=Actinoplanes sp. NPDC051633 TaxID=3155670 RepID=UPI00342B4F29